MCGVLARQSGRVTELAVVIGHEAHEHVVIRVLGRMHPGALDRWDGNWLRSPIEISVGGFSGVVSGAGLRGDELRTLRRGLENLYETLSGTASLESMEQWLDLRFEGDGSGRIEVTGTARDHHGVGWNALHFALEIDQTFLPPIIDSLKAIEASYEVLGADD